MPSFLPAASFWLARRTSTGWSVHDERAGYVGEVVEVAERATQPLLTVRRAEGGEALIPLVDEFIVDVDEDDRRIDVSLPAGLLDL